MFKAPDFGSVCMISTSAVILNISIKFWGDKGALLKLRKPNCEKMAANSGRKCFIHKIDSGTFDRLTIEIILG
jgi:hypothetical protein